MATIVINKAHADRHYADKSELLAAAEHAIHRAITRDADFYAAPGPRFPRRLIVQGSTIEFRAYVREDGTVHVGTHFPIDP